MTAEIKVNESMRALENLCVLFHIQHGRGRISLKHQIDEARRELGLGWEDFCPFFRQWIRTYEDEHRISLRVIAV